MDIEKPRSAGLRILNRWLMNRSPACRGIKKPESMNRYKGPKGLYHRSPGQACESGELWEKCLKSKYKARRACVTVAQG